MGKFGEKIDDGSGWNSSRAQIVLKVSEIESTQNFWSTWYVIFFFNSDFLNFFRSEKKSPIFFDFWENRLFLLKDLLKDFPPEILKIQKKHKKIEIFFSCRPKKYFFRSWHFFLIYHIDQKFYLLSISDTFRAIRARKLSHPDIGRNSDFGQRPICIHVSIHTYTIPSQWSFSHPCNHSSIHSNVTQDGLLIQITTVLVLFLIQKL